MLTMQPQDQQQQDTFDDGGACRQHTGRRKPRRDPSDKHPPTTVQHDSNVTQNDVYISTWRGMTITRTRCSETRKREKPVKLRHRADWCSDDNDSTREQTTAEPVDFTRTPIDFPRTPSV